MKPFVGFIKDTHLNQNNGYQVLEIFDQFIKLLLKHNIKYAIHFGDWFSERTGGHNIERFTTVAMIIRKFIDNEIKLFVISGNHDKTDLSDHLSYLTAYGLVANSEYFFMCNEYCWGDFDEQKIRFHFIPYYLEGLTYNGQLACVQYHKKYKNVLCTHIAVNGVRNNDGTVVEDGVPVSAFKDFDKVFVGHYHDESFIKPNIHYFPGSYQQNHGETDKKGFTLMAADLTTTFHRATFKQYKQLVVQATDKKGLQEISRELEKIDKDNFEVCVKVVGSITETQGLDVRTIRAAGAKVKFENNTETVLDLNVQDSIEKTTLTKGDLLKHYLKYTKEFDFTPEQRALGLKYLK